MVINCPNPACGQMLIMLTGRAPGWVTCNFCHATIELTVDGKRPADAEKVEAELSRRARLASTPKEKEKP